MFPRLRRIAPRNGWRAFIGEVGVIVLGVLIAVGIGKVVEALDWRDRVAATQAVLDADIRHDNAYDLAERVLVTPCMHRQLDRLHRIAADPTGRVSRARAYSVAGRGRVLIYPSRSWTVGAWDAALADNVPGHMSADDRRFYARHFLYVRMIGTIQAGEDADAADLSLLAESLPLGLQTRADLLRAIARERQRVELIDLIARRLLTAMRESGRPAYLSKEWLADMNTRNWCRDQGLLR